METDIIKVILKKEKERLSLIDPQQWEITPGKIYDAKLTPVIYDAMTFQPSRAYIIRCDDGKSRKMEIDLFMTVDEWRDKQLEDLGIS